MRRAILFVAVIVAAACAARGTPPVTAAHVSWAADRWPGTTEAELDQGRRLYRAKCSGCHLPPAPTSQSPEQWPGEIAEMKERAHLAPDEITLIERYVVTVASIADRAAR